MTAPSSDVPQFGALLAEYIVSVPEASRPRFLARLERGAADRYRGWAAALPDHADVLLECAASEEQIAIRVDALVDTASAYGRPTKFGAGDGNRTRTASLEGWNSTIELRPRSFPYTFRHPTRPQSAAAAGARQNLVEGVGFEPT